MAPVYLIHGPDTVRHEEVLGLLKKAVVPPGLEPLCYQEFSGDELRAAELVSAASTPSFGGGRRLVVVTGDLEFLEEDSELQTLLGFLQSPPDSACVVISTGETLQARHALIKAVGEAGRVIAAPLLNKGDLAVWAKEYAAGLGKRFDGAALTVLMERAEPDRVWLRTELDKLAAFTGDRKVITPQDVDAVTVKSRDESVFDLLDAVMNRNAGRSLLLLRQLLAQGEQPMGLLGLLARQVALVANASRLSGSGQSVDAIAAELKVKPFVVQKALKQSRLLDSEWVAQALESILQADLSIKKGAQPAALALELLVARMIMKRPSSRSL